MTPADIVKTYTYEVHGVTGAAFIRSARGGVSGFSASYYLSSGTLSTTPSTILFDTSIDAVQNTLTGTFRTFGRVAGADNNFTIEILYPSQTPGGGILQHTWDVTEQLSGNDTHIVIEDAGINIPDEGGDSAGGWDVDLGEWNDVTVQL